MKKKQFSEEQIALALYQAERTSVEDVTRHLGIAYSRVHYGYRRIHVALQREGWEINHKRFTASTAKRLCRCVRRNQKGVFRLRSEKLP